METDDTQYKKDGSDDGDGQAAITNRITEISQPNAANNTADISKAPPKVQPSKTRRAARKGGQIGWALVRRGYSAITGDRINVISTIFIAVFTVVLADVARKQRVDLLDAQKSADDALKAAQANTQATKQIAESMAKTAIANENAVKMLGAVSASAVQSVEQSKMANVSAEKSATAASVNALAASKSVAQNQLYNELAMRAFLFVIDQKLEATKSPRQILATILIKNTGQTPAQHVSLRSVMECIPINTDPRIFVTPEEAARKPLQYESPLQYRPLSQMLPLSPTARVLLQQNLKDKLNDDTPKVAPLQSEIITAAPESVGPSGQFQVSMPISVPDDMQWKAWNPSNKPAQLMAWVTGILLYEDYFGEKRYTRFTYKETKSLKTGGLDLVLADFANDLN